MASSFISCTRRFLTPSNPRSRDGLLGFGFLPYLAGLRIEKGRSFFDEGKRLLEKAGDYWQTLTLARTGNLIFVPLLLFYVYRWAGDLYGRTAAVAAVFLVSFSPTVIAHSAVATADLATSAAFTMAAFQAS